MPEITPILFEGEGIKEIVDRLDAECRAIVLDGSTKKGREECISLAMKVRKSKTAIDKVGAEIVKPIKEKAKKFDATRKYAKDKLDLLAVDLRKPATEWEEAEERRINGHREAIKVLGTLKDNVSFMTPAQLEERRTLLKTTYDRDFEDYQEDADNFFKATEAAIDAAMVEAKAKEAREKELAELRAFKEKQEAEEWAKKQKERDEALKKEAAEAAEKRLLEQQKAKEEAERKERERKAANVEHQRTINREALEDITKAIAAIDITGTAKAVLEAIVRGKVRHVSIKY